MSRFILILLHIALANVSAHKGKITQLSSPGLKELLSNNKANVDQNILMSVCQVSRNHLLILK